MKQLLIFSLFVILAFFADTEPVDLNVMHKDTIKVRVEGAVESPGVYEAEPYTTAEEILERAGITASADTDTINPSAVLKDRDILIVPEKREDGSTRISINTADAEALCTLPGVGPVIAERIIRYRDTNGFFQKTEDLLRIRGIGEKKYARLEEYICL